MGEGPRIMTRTNWSDQELRFLRRLSVQRPQPFYDYAAAELGLDEFEATDMLRDLRAEGYISFTVLADNVRVFGTISELRLAPSGRRVLGLWPRDDSQAEDVIAAMVAELQRRLEVAPSEEERGKVRALLTGLAGASRDVAVSVLSEVAKRQLGLT